MASLGRLVDGNMEQKKVESLAAVLRNLDFIL